MSTITLYRYQRSGIALAVCLADAFARATLIGYAQTPRRLLFGRWDGATFVDAGGRPLDLAQAYEARLFCEAGELRWLREPETGAGGRAAWISETDAAPTGFQAIEPLLQDLEPLDQLGIGDGLPNRIIAQTRARLPGIAEGQRGAYCIREYIGPAPGEAGRQGNHIVVEQRILGIAVWNEGGAG